jgi:AraC-like DNA-binding protein
MINGKVLWDIAAGVLPASFAFVAGVYVLLSLKDSSETSDVKLKLLTVAYLSVAMMGPILNAAIVGSAIGEYLSLAMPGVLAVLYYGIVCLMTTPKNESLSTNAVSKGLYFAPLMFLLLLAAVVLIEIAPAYKLAIESSVWIVYACLLIRQLFFYYKAVCQTEGGRAVRNLTYSIIIGIAGLPIVASCLFHGYVFTDSMLAIQTLVLACWVGSQQYQMFSIQPPRPMESNKLTRYKIEDYFRKEKPYLNSSYRMEDLQAVFKANRNNMSAFINRTFGMSFNTYLNSWRLKEYQRLYKMAIEPEQQHDKLLKKSGFSNQRQYSRALEQLSNTNNERTAC